MASLKFVTIKWLIFLGTKLSSFYIGKGWGYKSMKAITSFDSDLRKMSWPLLQRTIASVASYQTPKAKGARTHRSVVSILGFKVHQLSEEKRVHKMNIQQSLDLFDTRFVRIRFIRLHFLLPKIRFVRMSLDLFEFSKKNSNFFAKIQQKLKENWK